MTGETMAPSDSPSVIRTMCAIHCGRPSGRPAMPAPATAVMAPEISPPGSSAHRNSRPPALPMTSVSSTLRISDRLGRVNGIVAGLMANAGAADKCVQATAAMRADPPLEGRVNRNCNYQVLINPKSLRLVGRGLLAFRHELLALLAMETLGVGVLRALQRSCGARLLGLLFRGRGRRFWRRRGF